MRFYIKELPSYIRWLIDNDIRDINKLLHKLKR